MAISCRSRGQELPRVARNSHLLPSIEAGEPDFFEADRENAPHATMDFMIGSLLRRVCSWLPRLDEFEQLCVDLLGMRGGHAMRKAWIGLEGAALQKLDRACAGTRKRTDQDTLAALMEM